MFPHTPGAFSEYEEGFNVAVLHTPGAFSRGEGGSCRLTDEVLPGEKPGEVQLCGCLIRCRMLIEKQRISYTISKI